MDGKKERKEEGKRERERGWDVGREKWKERERESALVQYLEAPTFQTRYYTDKNTAKA